MFFADINHYLEVIYNSKGRFRTLRDPDFGLDNRGNPAFQAGSHAVIFKVSFAGKKSAMKCYTKNKGNQKNRQETVADYLNRLNSPFLSQFKFLDREIYVFDDFGKGSYYPVTLTEWVEGISLRGWLAEKCRTKNSEALAEIARKFCALALWLLQQEWAHGDLKPDNIIVTPEGGLRLIDYDSAFVPALAGISSSELGTPGFQHPKRSTKFYNRHLDDYSIALITAALYALAEFPEWYTEQDDDERLLFDPDEIMAGRSAILHRIKEHWMDTGQTALYRLAKLLGNPTPEIPELGDTLEQLSNPAVSSATPKKDAPEIYRKNGFYGYRIPQGKRLTEAVYDDAESFREGFAAVRIGKKCYYIDKDGKKRIDAASFDRIESFSNGLAAVRKGKKWGYLDQQGATPIEPDFENARPFREGAAAVEKTGKWGYIDTTGSFFIEPRFDYASDFREGIAVVGLNGVFGYIDRNGNWLIEPCYAFASGFRNGAATAEKDGRLFSITREHFQ